MKILLFVFSCFCNVVYKNTLVCWTKINYHKKALSAANGGVFSFLWTLQKPQKILSNTDFGSIFVVVRKPFHWLFIILTLIDSAHMRNNKKYDKKKTKTISANGGICWKKKIIIFFINMKVLICLASKKNCFYTFVKGSFFSVLFLLESYQRKIK